MCDQEIPRPGPARREVGQRTLFCLRVQRRWQGVRPVDVVELLRSQQPQPQGLETTVHLLQCLHGALPSVLQEILPI